MSVCEFSAWLLIMTLRMNPFFKKLADLVNRIRLHFLRSRIIISKCFSNILFDTDTLLIDSTESHHRSRIIIARRLFVELNGLRLILSFDTNIEEHVVSIEALEVGLPFKAALLEDLFLRLHLLLLFCIVFRLLFLHFLRNLQLQLLLQLLLCPNSILPISLLFLYLFLFLFCCFKIVEHVFE